MYKLCTDRTKNTSARLSLDVTLTGCGLGLRFYGEWMPTSSGMRPFNAYVDLGSLEAVEKEPGARSLWAAMIQQLQGAGSARRGEVLQGGSSIVWQDL